MSDVLGRKSIEELIAEMCPDGVEHRNLSNAIKLNFGVRVTKKDDAGSLYPVYGGGGASFRVDRFNREDDYVISRFAMSAKCVRRVDGKFWMLDSGFTFTPINLADVNKDFVYHFLHRHQYEIYNMSRGGGQKNLDIARFKSMIIPVPPLPIQEAIVAYLDTFSQLEAELEAEMEAELVRRKKQYEWYRTHLLDFKRQEVDNEGQVTGTVLDYQYADEYHARPAIENVREMVERMCPGGVEYKSIKEVCEIFVGGDVKKFPITEKGTTLVVSNGTGANAILGKTNVAPKIVSPSVTIAARGTIGHVQRFYQPISPVVRLIALVPGETILQGFLFHSLSSIDLGGEKTGIPSLTSKHLAVLRIPIPPLSVQQAIVELLDQFDELVNSMRDGISAEIIARRQQYEYYRENLLSFEQKPDGVSTSE